MLQFDKIYKYFNSYMQALKDELITDSKLKDTPIPIESIKIKFNGGDLLPGDYTLDNRTFTITNTDITAADCKVFRKGNIQLTSAEYKISGNDITIEGGTALTEFDIKLFSNVGNYLQGIHETDTYGNSKYITNGVIENLGIQLLDKRVLTYMQTVSVGITSKAEHRDNIMLLCGQFANELHDSIVEITDTTTYSLQIMCTQMPQYTQNYKGHGIEEFDTSILFDIKVSTYPDYSKKETLYIDGTVIPYSTLETLKKIELEPDLQKIDYMKYSASFNMGVIRVIGISYSDNSVLQALKNEVRDFAEFETEHILKVQKGKVITGTIASRTITVADTSNLILYNNDVKMVLGTDYSITGKVITVLDNNITMAEITVLQGLYAFIYTYTMILTEGTILNTYGENIEYTLTFNCKR